MKNSNINSGSGFNENDGEKLKSLFIDSLKDIYWAEQSLTSAIPKMSKAALSNDLKAAFDAHLAETEKHVTRLERVFELIGEVPKAKK